MVTANERLVAQEERRQPGLLREQVERDMAETLSEFGSPPWKTGPKHRSSTSATGFRWPECATTASCSRKRDRALRSGLCDR